MFVANLVFFLLQYSLLSQAWTTHSVATCTKSLQREMNGRKGGLSSPIMLFSATKTTWYVHGLLISTRNRLRIAIMITIDLYM